MLTACCKRRPRFCNTGCRDAFAGDRAAGLIYVATRVVDEHGKYLGAYSAEHWSIRSGTCAYCSRRCARPIVTMPPTWTADGECSTHGRRGPHHFQDGQPCSFCGQRPGGAA